MKWSRLHHDEVPSESMPVSLSGAYGGNGTISAGYDGVIALWHNRNSHVGYCDGHVSPMSAEEAFDIAGDAVGDSILFVTSGKRN